MPKVEIQVNGRLYGGWKSARVMRGIETVSGSFQLEVSERFPEQGIPWAIVEEDECKILLDGKVVITGYVDTRGIDIDDQSHSLTVEGRDKTGDLVDCSVYLEHSGAGKKGKGKKAWQFLNVSVIDLAKRVCAPYGIEVLNQTGLAPPKIAKLAVSPGDSASDVIEKACRLAGVLPVANGRGALLLTRGGSNRSKGSLVMGQNILRASVSYNASTRYANYVALGQSPGTDDWFGTGPTHVIATASDANVKRGWRTLIVRPENVTTAAQAQVRAQWEAKTRAARAEAITVAVQGWEETPGTLWQLNARVPVRIPQAGIDGELIIGQAVHSVDSSGGSITQLTLRRPDAYLPEPVVTVAGTAQWKELKGGVK